jgi:DNA-binding MarR family transcriptional regulator
MSTDEVASLLMQWMAASMRTCQQGALAESFHLLDELGATMPMTVALHVLAFAGPQTMTQLSTQIGLSASATSHLLQRLVELSLAQRHDVPGDRRQRLLAITPRGQRAVDELMSARLTEMRESLAPLSTTTRTRLGLALRAVLTELAAAQKPVCPAHVGVTEHDATSASPAQRPAPRAPRERASRTTSRTTSRTSPRRASTAAGAPRAAPSKRHPKEKA